MQKRKRLREERMEHVGLTCEQMNGAVDARRHWEARGSCAVELVRQCLIRLAKFVRADLYGGCEADFYAGLQRREPPRVQANDDDDGFRARPLARKLRQLRSAPAWLQLVRLFFLYFTLKLALQTLWMAAYHLHRFSVKRLRARLEGQAAGAQVAQALRRQLELEQAGLAGALGALNAIGAPYLEFSFGMVAANVFLIAIAYSTFMHTQLFFALAHPFNFGVARALLAGRLEQRHQINGAICAQVNRFLTSADNFLQTRLSGLALVFNEHAAAEQSRAAASAVCHLESLFELNGGGGGGGGPPGSGLGRVRGAPPAPPSERELFEREASRLIARQASISARLRQLALADGLQPPNRNSAWLERLARLYLAILSAIYLTGSAIVVGILLIIPFGGLLATKGARSNPRDLLFTGEMFLYCQVALFSVMFYLPIVTVSCADQIYHALALMRNIDAAVRANDLWLEQRKLAERSPALEGQLPLPARAKCEVAPASEQLNSNLVAVLLRVKIFEEQLITMKPSAGLGSSICIFLVSVIPTISRVFAHHLETDLKLLLLVNSLVFVLFADFFIVPNCYLHSRCLDLYKRLSRLLARAIEINSTGGLSCATPGAGGQTLYDCHTIWLLRKELSLPEKSLSKFVPTALRLQLNYASLLRVHFWCGLLLISMFYSDSSQQAPGGLLDESLHFF